MRKAMIVGDSIPVRRAAIVLTITNTRGARCGLQRHLWYDQV